MALAARHALTADRQRLSHRSLLQPLPRARREGHVDAIVVPTARAARALGPAAALAARLHTTTLVVLHSDAGEVDATRAVLEAAGVRRGVVSALPRGYQHAGLRFSATPPDPDTARWYPDLATKRNLAIMLAALAGWSNVLFLDDDIEGLDPPAVRRAAARLGRCRAIGWSVGGHPDNSVVCHAARRAGMTQDTFVGGSALLVDTARAFPYFPAIYNEDWLALWRLVAAGAVGRAGAVRQLPYEPFDDPIRARAQEFGDTLAEGLMAALHTSAAWPVGCPEYWRRRLEARQALIAGVSTEAAVAPALAAAGAASAGLDPAALAGFVAAQARELRHWSRRLRNLPRVRAVDEALRRLELTVAP